jgi:hypothetical protein
MQVKSLPTFKHTSIGNAPVLTASLIGKHDLGAGPAVVEFSATRGLLLRAFSCGWMETRRGDTAAQALAVSRH